jgi:hypothetical protein
MRPRASGDGTGHWRFAVQNAALELIFAQRGRVLPEVLVDELHGPVARRAGCAAGHAAGPTARRSGALSCRDGWNPADRGGSGWCGW